MNHPENHRGWLRALAHLGTARRVQGKLLGLLRPVSRGGFQAQCLRASLPGHDVFPQRRGPRRDARRVHRQYGLGGSGGRAATGRAHPVRASALQSRRHRLHRAFRPYAPRPTRRPRSTGSSQTTHRKPAPRPSAVSRSTTSSTRRTTRKNASARRTRRSSTNTSPTSARWSAARRSRRNGSTNRHPPRPPDQANPTFLRNPSSPSPQPASLSAARSA